jgi:hypothetical protein
MATGTFPESRAPQPRATSRGNDPSPDTYIDRQLRRTQWQVRLVDSGAALLVWCAALLLSLFAFAVIDHWLVPLGTVGRWLALLALAAGSVYYFIMQLGPLLICRINSAYAAKVIEDAEPSLKNSLLNFLLLRSNHAGVSEVVVDALRQRAAADLTHAPIDHAVDRAPLIRLGYALCGVMVLFTLYKFLSPKDPFRTVARVLAPWAEIAPASRVRILHVQPGNSEVYQGQVVAITADLEGVDERDAVHLVYSTADGQTVQAQVPMTTAAGLHFTAQLPAGPSAASEGLQQDITYRIAAGDAESADYRLHVLPRPRMEVERVELHFPAYTKRDSQTITRQGDLRAVEGTRAVVHAKANQPIASAFIEFDPTAVRNERPRIPAIAMRHEGRTAEGEFLLERLADGSPRYHSYQIRYLSEAGLKNDRPTLHRIEVVPDLAPEIQMLAPSQRRIDLPVNRTTMLELRGRDPDFGLCKISLELANGERPLELATLWERSEGQLGPTTARYEIVPEKLGLQPGDELFVVGVAADNRHDRAGEPAPNVSRTDRYTVRIAPPELPLQQPGDAADDPASKAELQNPPQQPNPQQPNRQQPPRGSKADKPKPGEKQSGEKQSGEKQSGEKQSGEKQSGEKQSGEKQSGEKQSGEKQSGEKQSGEKQSGEKQSGEKQSGEKQSEGAEGGNSSDDREMSEKKQQQTAGEGGGSSGEQQEPSSEASDAGSAGGQSSSGDSGEGASGESSEPSGTQGTSKAAGQAGGASSQGAGAGGENSSESGGDESSLPGDNSAKPSGNGQQSNTTRNGQAGNAGEQPGERPADASGENAADAATPNSASGNGNPSQNAATRPPQHDGETFEEVLKRLREEQQHGKSGSNSAGAEKPENVRNAAGNPGEASPMNSGPPRENGAQSQPSGGAQPMGAPATGEQGEGEQGEGEQRQPPEKAPGGGASGDQGAEARGASKPEQPNLSEGSKGEPTPPSEGDPGASGDPPARQEQSPMGAAGEKSSDRGAGPAGDKPATGQQEKAGSPMNGQGEQPGDTPMPKTGGQGKQSDPSAGQVSQQQMPSGEPKGANRDRQKPSNSAAGKQEGKGSPSPASKSERQSDSQGNDSGERSGDGGAGAGQQSKQKGNDTPGSSSAADSGAGAAEEPGQGETGNQAGRDQKSQGATGQAGDEPGAGSQSKPGESGSKTNPQGSGKQPGGTGAQPQPRSPQPSGDRSQAGPGNGDVTGGGLASEGDVQPGTAKQKEIADTEAERLEYARQSTDLALQYLKDQQNNPDPELLKRLGWTKNDLDAFLQRWETLKSSAQEDTETRSELDDAYRSLGLRPGADKRRSAGAGDDSARSLRDAGARSEPPAGYAEQFKAFRKAAGRK